MQELNNFESLVSAWHHLRRSEVGPGVKSKPETINYRTLKPERKGFSVKRYSVPPRTGSATVENIRELDSRGSSAIAAVLK